MIKSQEPIVITTWKHGFKASEKAYYIFKNNISEINKNINNKYDVPNNFIKIDELIVDGALLYEIYKNTKKN